MTRFLDNKDVVALFLFFDSIVITFFLASSMPNDFMRSMFFCIRALRSASYCVSVGSLVVVVVVVVMMFALLVVSSSMMIRVDSCLLSAYVCGVCVVEF